jgi:hypothetical protein
MADILFGARDAVATIAFSGTQQINSLTNNETTDPSDEVSNDAASTERRPFADFLLELGSAAFASADAAVEIFIIPTIDGTNYPEWDGNTATPGNHIYAYYVGAFLVKNTTAARTCGLRAIPLPAGDFKVALRNRTGVSLAATANALKIRRYFLTA